MTDTADLSADDVETAVGASLELIMAHEVGEADVLYDLTSGDVIDILTFFLLSCRSESSYICLVVLDAYWPPVDFMIRPWVCVLFVEQSCSLTQIWPRAPF